MRSTIVVFATIAASSMLLLLLSVVTVSAMRLHQQQQLHDSSSLTGTIYMLSQGSGNGCSGDHCCSGGETCYSSSQLNISSSSSKHHHENRYHSLPINVTFSGECNALRCQCYDAGTTGQIVDLTNIARQNPGRKFTVTGSGTLWPFQTGSCSPKFTVDVLKPHAANAKYHELAPWWPAPYDGPCKSDTSGSPMCQNQTVMHSEVCSGGTIGSIKCKTSVQIPKSLSVTGGAFLLTVNVNSSCDIGEFCIYGGSGFGHATATIDLE